MDIFDLVAAAGLAMLFAGLWLLAPWVALTVTGGLLAVGGYVAARLDVIRELVAQRQQA